MPVVPSFLRISQPPGYKPCLLHPCPSRLTTRIHISINSVGLYLYPECLSNFVLNLYISPWLGKFFRFMVFTSLESALNLCIFTHVSLPTQNTPPSSYHRTLGRGKLIIPAGGIFSNICFPQHQKGVEKTITCFIKIQSENVKMIWTIYLYFVWFVIFPNVMALQFCQ